MPRFDFESPGAAITGQITQLLAQRKADERQQMLDQLTMNADQRAAQAAAREQKESDQRLANEKQQGEIALLNAMTSRLPINANPTDYGFSPENIELGRKYGQFKQLPATPPLIAGSKIDQSSGEYSAPDAPKYGFVGNPQEQERIREETQFGNTVAAMMASPDPAQRALGERLSQQASLNGGRPTPGMLEQEFSSVRTKPLYVFHQETGRVTDANGKAVDANHIPADAQIVTQQYQPYHQPKSFLSAGIDPNTGNAVFFDPNTKERVVVPGTAKPGAKLEGQLQIPGYALTPVENAIGELGADPVSVDEGALADYRAKAAAAMMNSKASKAAVGIAVEYLNSPQQAMKHAATLIDAGKLTSKDVDEIKLLTDGLVPEVVKDMLKANPYSPNANKPGLIERLWNAAKQ